MSQPEQHSFQAEIQQLLNLVIHSLYTDREVFVRELISNAADACEKLRFLQASGQVASTDAGAAGITLAADAAAGTLTFADTGVGMTREELTKNLGTIAHSGTKAFLESLAKNQAANSDQKLIGQFGVGFYSACMVADRVTVVSKTHAPGAEAWRWSSEGGQGYTLEPAAEAPGGPRRHACGCAGARGRGRHGRGRPEARLLRGPPRLRRGRRAGSARRACWQ